MFLMWFYKHKRQSVFSTKKKQHRRAVSNFTMRKRERERERKNFQFSQALKEYTYFQGWMQIPSRYCTSSLLSQTSSPLDTPTFYSLILTLSPATSMNSTIFCFETELCWLWERKRENQHRIQRWGLCTYNTKLWYRVC